MIESTVKNRISQLPDEYVEFLASDFISDATTAFGSELGLEEESLEYFQNGILLYLTLFIDQTELAAFFARECYLPEPVAQQTAEAITQSLPDDIQVARESGYEILHPAGSTPATHDLQQEIAETTESLQQIQSMRTMQTDYQKQAPEPTSAPQGATPNAAAAAQAAANKPQPRWDSDAK